ncbi:hypothetical protein AOA81_02660 [Methanomassiliicoccales archaeon RumEn M2]|nr:hypothetical protein AOA81_02660 [Methanomassiliicoccales archaeon RumEn M2]
MDMEFLGVVAESDPKKIVVRGGSLPETGGFGVRFSQEEGRYRQKGLRSGGLPVRLRDVTWGA